MSDLDRKLEDITFTIRRGERDSVSIEQIKRAFIDEGWMQLRSLEDDMTRAINKLGDDIRHEHKCMTGQEWYDRFEKELPYTNTDCSADYVNGAAGCTPVDHAERNGRYNMLTEALVAARRSAGLVS